MKDFKIKAGQIVRLIGPVGAATATDMIMVEGRDIRYMYRESPINEIDTVREVFSPEMKVMRISRIMTIPAFTISIRLPIMPRRLSPV